MLFFKIPQTSRVVFKSLTPVWFDPCHFFVSIHCLLVFGLFKETSCNLTLDPSSLLLFCSQLLVLLFSFCTLKDVLKFVSFSNESKQIHEIVALIAFSVWSQRDALDFKLANASCWLNLLVGYRRWWILVLEAHCLFVEQVWSCYIEGTDNRFPKRWANRVLKMMQWVLLTGLVKRASINFLVWITHLSSRSKWLVVVWSIYIIQVLFHQRSNWTRCNVLHISTSRRGF